MIVIMKNGASADQIQVVEGHLVELGFQVNPIYGAVKTVIGAVGRAEHEKLDAADALRAHDGVEDVVLVSKPYKFVAKEANALGKSQIDLGDGVIIGGDEAVMMAGPCTVESEEQLFTTADAVAEAGATILRGGAYKPSTSPYSFHGMGRPGLELLRAAADKNGMKVITEVMHVRKIDEVCEFADVLQIGTRNMQNYELLREVGQVKKPVMLKRGMTSKYEEWLLAAEYIAAGGNENIMLCERGIRTFESATRNTLDIGAVPVLNSLTHLPIIIDPSQGTGRRDLVGPMCRAGLAAGADGLIVEVHPNPDHAVKDGAQSVTIASFEEMMPSLIRIANAVDRPLAMNSRAGSGRPVAGALA